MIDYWDLDYSSLSNLVNCLENESHVAIFYNNIVVETSKILSLLHQNEEDFTGKYGYEYNFPVNKIIINHMATLKSSIPLMCKTFRLPYIVHPDHHLNMLKSDIIFIGYRKQGILLDPQILIDGEEYYISELLKESSYDERVLTFITRYLERGYYLPYLLRCYEVMTKRQKYLRIMLQEESQHYLYYDESLYLSKQDLHTLDHKKDLYYKGFIVDDRGVSIRFRDN
jgi:hypothetical protein